MNVLLQLGLLVAIAACVQAGTLKCTHNYANCAVCRANNGRCITCDQYYKLDANYQCVPDCPAGGCGTGSCVYVNGATPGFACSCPAGYTGANCQWDGCNPYGTPVCDQGTCTASSSSPYYTCACYPGWTGTNCDVNRCAGVVCNNGGACNPNTGACDCVNGYTGPNCDTSPCFGNCAHGDGCSVDATAPNNYRCTSCHTGWTGVHCDQCAAGYHPAGSCHLTACQDATGASICGAGGVSCTFSGASYTCTCLPQYSGTNCQVLNLCYGVVCDNGGACNAATGQCNCVNGWTGASCTVSPCSGNCVHGTGCTADPNAPGYYKCTGCQTGWTGVHCDQCAAGYHPPSTCAYSACQDANGNNVCLNGGTCSLSGSSFTCTCPVYYSGLTCADYDYCTQQQPCPGGVCSNSANTATGTPYTCTCSGVAYNPLSDVCCQGSKYSLNQWGCCCHQVAYQLKSEECCDGTGGKVNYCTSGNPVKHNPNKCPTV